MISYERTTFDAQWVQDAYTQAFDASKGAKEITPWDLYWNNDHPDKKLGNVRACDAKRIHDEMLIQRDHWKDQAEHWHKEYMELKAKVEALHKETVK
jgi:hypothetical protein